MDNLSGAIGTIALYCMYTLQKFANFMSVPVSVSCPCSCQFLYVAMNIIVRNGKYVSFLFPRPVRGGRKNLKCPSHERGWVKSAENLGTSPLKRDERPIDWYRCQSNPSRWTVPLMTILSPCTIKCTLYLIHQHKNGFLGSLSLTCACRVADGTKQNFTILIFAEKRIQE